MVDILLATYNGEKYLREQMDSLLNQTYKDIHIVIRDDNSKDETEKIILEYVNKYPNIIEYVKDDIKCGSATANFMQLAKHSTADYIMFCDQDDVWLPIKVEHTLKQMQELEKNNESNKPALVFGNYIVVDGALNPISDSKKGNQTYKMLLDFNHLLVQNYVTGCLMMINRRLKELLGEYEDSILMHDWWIALIASGAGNIKHFEEDLMYYRQHGNNVVGATNVKSIKYIFSKLFDSKTKESMKSYEKQASLLAERLSDDLSKESKQALSDFLEISNTKSKIKRIRMLKKGNYLKSDLIRRLGQYFYI